MSEYGASGTLENPHRDRGYAGCTMLLGKTLQTGVIETLGDEQLGCDSLEECGIRPQQRRATPVRLVK